MSRAYRIRVRESVSRVIRAEDRVSTELEMLDILPPEAMAELLANELEKRGYERQGGTVSKTVRGVTVEVDVTTGTVTVKSESKQDLTLEQERELIADTDWSDSRKSQLEQNLRKQVQEELNETAKTKQAELQRQTTSVLEKELGDVRQELDGAVNRVTAEALKQRAAQIGEIKQIVEEPSGSMTIVVEV